MEAQVQNASNEPRCRATMKEPWTPRDLRTNRNRQRTLLRKVEICTKILGNSLFYHDFQHLLLTSSISRHLHRVLGAESKMQMVIYGIGSFESSQYSMWQLCLAILMQEDFKWIGNIEIFDPVLSVTECRVLEALGCSVSRFDEDGKKRVLKPTIFFMPHCPVHLYNNVLEANWNCDLLRKVVIFGNSFNSYKMMGRPDSLRPIWTAHKFTDELIMRHSCCVSKKKKITRHYCLPVESLSWMFFSPTAEKDLRFMENIPEVESKIELQIDPCRVKNIDTNNRKWHRQVLRVINSIVRNEPRQKGCYVW